MTTQNKRMEVELEEDNAWANEIGIEMHYPRYLEEPDEFREDFESQMLSIFVAACAEQEHGTDVMNFLSTASQILGEPLTEEGVRKIFGCHSLATFWEEHFPGCVINQGSRFELVALPGDETGFMGDMEKLRANCVKRDKEKKEIRIVEAAQPENVQKFMESFNRLYVLLQGINEGRKVSINTPVKYSDIANAFKTLGITLNREYTKENYGRSRLKLVFQDNSQTIFSQRLEYIEDPTKDGIFSIAIKPGAERLTEEEIAEAVEKAKRYKEALTTSKKAFQPRENRQYHTQSKKASEDRIQLSDADRALFQDKSASTFVASSQVNRRNSPPVTESNPPRNMYSAPKTEIKMAQPKHEGQNYTSEEESSDDEQGSSRLSKQKQPPQTKPSRIRGPAQDDDRLPVEEDQFDAGYSQMNDDHVELPLLDRPSYNQQVQRESPYQNQPPQNLALNIDDYFNGSAQQMMFDNPTQFNRPVQNVRDSAQQFAPNPNDSLGSQRRSHSPHQGVPAQNQSIYNHLPRVANFPTDFVSPNAPYGYGEPPLVQGNYPPGQRYQGNNIAEPTPASQGASQRSDSSAPGRVSVSNYDHHHQTSSSYVTSQRIGYGSTPRLGSFSSAFQQGMSRRTVEAQTPHEMIADYQLNLTGPREKRDVMIDAIISMVQLHDENNQDLRLSNLGSKLSAFCGIEVSPKDFYRENWIDVIEQDCNRFSQKLQLQPFRGGDFHVFFIKSG